MSMKVNQSAVKYAKELINQGNYVVDSDWSESQASSDEENQFINDEGWEQYARWHLAYDPDESEETKKRFGFPFGDLQKVHRSALNAAQQRAGQNDYHDIEEAADDLVSRIDQKESE